MRTASSLAKSVSFIILTVLLLGSLILPAAAAPSSVVLAITGGDNQTALIGAPYAQPLQVTVTQDGLPLAGALVVFTAIAGREGASLDPQDFTATTDALGVASAPVTANGSVGAMKVYADYGGQTVTFHLANTEVLMVTISGGDDQSAVVETPYADPLAVTVTRNGAPVAGAVVEFAAPKHPGDAGLVPDTFTATTGADGVAAAAVTANIYAGPVEVTASYGGQTATFHLTNILQPPLLSTSPYILDSHCEFLDGAAAHDPAANGNARLCYLQATKVDCEQHWFCWWRDTTSQNALADSTYQESTGTVYQPYSSAHLKVLFYSSYSGANVVALVGTSSWYLIGAGGGRDEANAAKMAFQAFYPTFSSKTLKGIILTSASSQVAWGGQFWRNAFRTVPPAPIYASATYFDALDRAALVAPLHAMQDEAAYGRALTWGSDSFLGLGSGYAYRPQLPFYVAPSQTIAEEVTFLLDGSTPITLVPTLSETGGLMVWLPSQGILIPPDLFGRFLPPIAPLNGRYIPIESAMAALDQMRSMQPSSLLFMHGMYLTGASTIQDALAVEYDALKYVYDETLAYMNLHQHIDDGDDDSDPYLRPPDIDGDGVFDDHPAVMSMSVDDMAELIHLPDNLANSPYARETAGAVASIVRAVYHEHVGGFDGNVAHLGTLTTDERARRMVDLAGGESAMRQYAHQCLTEHTREGLQMALELSSILRRTYPSEDANDIYIQALKMLAWTTPNGPQRDAYLLEAYNVGRGIGY